MIWKNTERNTAEQPQNVKKSGEPLQLEDVAGHDSPVV